MDCAAGGEMHLKAVEGVFFSPLAPLSFFFHPSSAATLSSSHSERERSYFECEIRQRL